MTNESINDLLTRVHAVLATTTSLDPTTRSAGELVAGDLARLGVAPVMSAPTPHGLEALAVRFEVEHPQLAATLRQVAGMLANAGI
jgi:hypothetical protein